MKMQVQSLDSLSGLRIWYCRELWCKQQMRLGSRVAVAVAQAGSCSSEWTPSLGTSMCRRCSPKRQKDQKKKKKERERERRGREKYWATYSGYKDTE